MDDHAFCGLILFGLIYFCTDVGGLNFVMKQFVCFVGDRCGRHLFVCSHYARMSKDMILMIFYFSFAWESRGLVSNQQRCEHPGPYYELAQGFVMQRGDSRST